MSLLIANWKMHGSRTLVRGFAYHVNAALGQGASGVSVVFCPPSIYLETARAALPLNAQLTIGAQNVSAHDAGAYTGETSAAMLADVGAKYVIIGHSERRAQHGETDADVHAKAKAAASAGITPVICIGESLAQYEAKQTAKIIATQLALLVKEPIAGAIIAYEPIWAIGSGKTPTIAEIEAVHSQIKSLLGSGVLVLYGGSVKPSNVAEILALPSVNGALIGSASLEVSSMRAMMDAVTKN